MPLHVVVDGSNLATEGRSLPSLKQLNDAVLAFIDEHPDALITVVADATFGHRIDKSEVEDFDAAVANNEIVCPPAGAVGRGDAFVLSIANKVGATILSNDSYQEFHGTYTWLFDEGRLIGGKPVPHVGWVFVTRTPVRGLTSRKAVADAKRKGGKVHGSPVRAGAKASPEASQPMPVPTSPPPGARVSPKGGAAAIAASSRRTAAEPASGAPSHKQSAVHAHVNELMPFLTFVGSHPVGAAVSGVVDHYSSHGAYVRLDEIIGYVPLRLIADPPPRSAREAMKVGETIELVVDTYNPGRRSVDLASASFAARLAEQQAAEVPRERPAKRAPSKAAGPAATGASVPIETVGDSSAPAKRRRRTAASAAVEAEAPTTTEVSAAPVRRSRKRAVPVIDHAGTANEVPAQPTTPGTSAQPSAGSSPEKVGAVKPPAKKAPATKTQAPKAPAPKDPATKTQAKRAPATEAAANTAAVDLPVVKRSTASRSKTAVGAPPDPAAAAPAKKGAAKSPTKSTADNASSASDGGTAAVKTTASAPTKAGPATKERRPAPAAAKRGARSAKRATTEPAPPAADDQPTALRRPSRARPVAERP